MSDADLRGAAAVPDRTPAAVPFTVEGDLYRWTLSPGGPRVELHSRVVQHISNDLLQNASDGAEDVGGLLLGTLQAAETKATRISGVEPCRSGDLHRVLAFWAHRAIVSARSAPARDDSSVVGFYRVSLDEDFDFSELDRNLAERYFSEAGKVFLLVKPAGPRSASARLFYWDAGRLRSEAALFPDIETKLEIAREPGRGLPSNVRELPKPPGAPALPLPLPVHAPEPEPQLSPVTSRKGLLVVLALIAIASAGLFYWNREETARPASQQGSPSAAALGLGISGSATGLVLTWNTNTPGLTAAKVGLVTVRDGSKEQELPLDKNQLLTGRLFYVPSSTMVRFSMQVFTENLTLRDYAMAIVPRDGPAEVTVAKQPPAAVPNPRSAPAPAQPPPNAPKSSAQQEAPEQPSPVPATQQTTEPAASQTAQASPGPTPAPPKEGAQSTPPPANEAVERPASTPAARSPEHREQPRPEASRTTEVTETRAAAPQPAVQASKLADRPAVPNVPPEPKPALTPPVPAAPPTSAADYVPPQAIRQAQPLMPANLRTLVTREVLIEVILSIDAKGDIQKAQPSSTEGTLNQSLARLAVDAARLWKFRPARQANKPVPGEVRIQFRFGPGR